MKKSIFTLASVTVVCACGLVIDPDKLVEGNATPIDNGEAGPDTSTGDTDGGGENDTGASDANTDGNVVVEVPECVPALPTTPGAKGPYAVVTVTKGAPAACPPGYLATVVDQGDGQFSAPQVTCASSAGCSCGTGTGTAKCGLRIRYYDDNQCMGAEADTPTTVGFGCPSIDDEDFIKVETTVSGITCPASGSATPSAKPAPSFGTTTIICAPDPNVKTAQCKGDDIPLPVAKDAAACIIVPTNASCSGGDYGASRFLSKTGAFTDTRGCNCDCTGNASASCTGGSIKTWPGLSFCMGGTSASVAAGTCRARGGNDDAANVENAPTASGTPGCTTRATPTGEATPTFDLKLCCLGSSSGGDGS